MMPASIDATDRRIIRATQAGLPLTPRPYHDLADELGLDPQELMARLNALLDSGVIRRIGVVPNHYRLGYRANGMTVWDVPDEVVDKVGARIGALPAVSHCYRRPRQGSEWPYNLFAMVHGRSRAEVEREAEHIAELLGPHDRGHTVLYSTRILKKTGLRIGD